jgi:hypothetical protein
MESARKFRIWLNSSRTTPKLKLRKLFIKETRQGSHKSVTIPIIKLMGSKITTRDLTMLNIRLLHLPLHKGMRKRPTESNT